jgi:hypothetical protein
MRSPQRHALAIMIWHVERGLALARVRLGPERFAQYQSEIERLKALPAGEDGVEVESAQAIAVAQLERLQWSSGEELPDELRYEFGIEARTLGEAARAILGGYHETPLRNDLSPLRHGERRTIRYRSEDDLLHSAGAIYPQYASRNGVGAIELLVAFALERQQSDGEVTFLPPEAWGLAEVPPEGRENDLLDLARNGVLSIDAQGETVPQEEEERDAVSNSRERE